MRPLSSLAKRLLVVSLAAGVAVVLSGCGDLLVVDNPNGAGTCGGHPVTIATTQDTPGENVTVSYTGPANVALFLSPSIYSDTSFDGEFAQRVVTFGSPAFSGAPNAAIYRVDTGAAGWTISGSGNSTTYAFSGSFPELLDGHSPYADLIFGPTGSLADSIVPYSVLVDCNASDSTQILAGNDDETVIATAPTFTAAAALFPNHVITAPLVVTSSDAAFDGNGVTGTVRFAPSTVSDLGGFVPTSSSVWAFTDDASMSNESFSSLYGQGLKSTADASFSFSGPIDLAGRNHFTFRADTAPTLADGSYILLMALVNEDASMAKFVFAMATYSSEGGLSISDPFTPAAGGETALASTGVNSANTGLIAGGGAVLALLGAGALVALRRRTIRH